MTADPRGPLPPGSVIGIMGGGQLARMLAGAAADLGFKTHIYVDTDNAPALDVSSDKTIAPYDDDQALATFASAVDVVTYEFENLPAQSFHALSAQGTPVSPDVEALVTSQDRLREKEFAQTLGAQTAPFEAVSSVDELEAAVRTLKTPTILKTRRFGYDGKGQVRIPEFTNEQSVEMLQSVWEQVGSAPCILEAVIPFDCEISVVAARSVSGDIDAFDPPTNEHKDGILRRSRVPATASNSVLEEAENVTRRLLYQLGYVGVVAVEFFVQKDGSVLFNEFAPRVHNTGHWTEAACVVSQFEQHIRAIAGWPLGSTERFANASMENLIGDEALEWHALAADAAARLTLYGKSPPRPGRKMGHVTRLSPLGDR